MTHVTGTVKRVVDTQLTAGLRRVRNDGPDPINISIDPEVTFGEGTRIDADGAAQLLVPTGRSLYAICDGEGEADVALVEPIADSGSAAQVFEVTDLLIPAGTDWSSGHVLQAVSLEAGQGVFAAVMIETAAAPLDHITLSTWWPEADFLVAAFGASAVADVGPGGVETYAESAGLSSRLDAFGATKRAAAAPAPGSLHVGLSTDGATAHDITIVRARAALLVI